MSRLPVARVDGLRADGSVAVAEGYLPPALCHRRRCRWYAGLLQEVVTGLDRIAEAHGKLVLGGAGRSIENLLLLELANTARPRLGAYAGAEPAPPVRACSWNLRAWPGGWRPMARPRAGCSDLPTYDHLDPQPAFAALADTLRSLILSPAPCRAEIARAAGCAPCQNIWKVRIDNPDILQNSRIVLRVGSDMSDESLRRIFVDQATVGAADAFEKLWKSRLPGIALKPLHSQPREIPYDGERLCLELDQKSEHWAQLLDAPGFVIGVSGALDTRTANRLLRREQVRRMTDKDDPFGLSNDAGRTRIRP